MTAANPESIDMIHIKDLPNAAEIKDLREKQGCAWYAMQANDPGTDEQVASHNAARRALNEAIERAIGRAIAPQEEIVW